MPACSGMQLKEFCPFPCCRIRSGTQSLRNCYSNSSDFKRLVRQNLANSVSFTYTTSGGLSTIAMSLWSRLNENSLEKSLSDGLSENCESREERRVPCKSSITEARQRVGRRVMSRLFHQVVRPRHATDSLSFGQTASDGGRWNSIRRAR